STFSTLPRSLRGSVSVLALRTRSATDPGRSSISPPNTAFDVGGATLDFVRGSGGAGHGPIWPGHGVTATTGRYCRPSSGHAVWLGSAHAAAPCGQDVPGLLEWGLRSGLRR